MAGDPHRTLFLDARRAIVHDSSNSSLIAGLLILIPSALNDHLLDRRARRSHLAGRRRFSDPAINLSQIECVVSVYP